MNKLMMNGFSSTFAEVMKFGHAIDIEYNFILLTLYITGIFI